MELILSFAEAAERRRSANRRVTVRYRCAPATAGRLIRAEDTEYQRAWIDNISKGGVGIFVNRPVELGAVVTIAMRSADDAIREFAGQVAHCAPKDPYGWYVGVEFFDLLDERLMESVLW